MSAPSLPAKHALHSSFSHPLLRSLSAPSPTRWPAAEALMWPVFVTSGGGGGGVGPPPPDREEIAALPGQARWSASALAAALDGPVADGLRAVLLFGVLPAGAARDGRGSGADAPGAPVLQALAAVRARHPALLLAVDVCLCAYTDHGHCGLLHADGALDNGASRARIAEVALAYARAGAHVVAPSDMMDGRVAAIKAALAGAGGGLAARVAVLSYAAKFASCFYGPFRAAAGSGVAPGRGDRAAYQLPPGGRALAARAVARDVEEGADMVMVKPGMPYLDVLADTAAASPVPVAVYQVSGEYAMLVHAAAAGAFDLRAAVQEALVAFRRAGAAVVITYFAPQVLRWQREEEADERAAAERAAAERAAAQG